MKQNTEKKIKMTTPAPKYSKSYLLKEMYYGFRPNKPSFTPEQYPDLTNKSAIVTGMNIGIGFEVSKLLYGKNCNIIGVVRNGEKAKAAREKILAEFSESKGSITIIDGCDLSDFTTIKSAANKIKEAVGNNPLNLIIHNAGLMAPVNTGTSKQGLELMFATNVMGPQLLQHFIDPLFLKKDDDLKRIVWVSSYAHFLGFPEYGINWENPTFAGVDIKERPSANTLYGQSKAANIYQAKAWATKNDELVTDIGCVSVSCYPGNITTGLTRDHSPLAKYVLNHLLWDGYYGAYSELYAALSPDLTIKNQGAYIVPFGEVHDPREDVKAGLANGTDLKLWEWVENEIKPYF